MRRNSTVTEMLIRQRLNALTRTLPAAQKGDVPSVHQARVATRRLREALPVIAGGTRGRKLERDVRRVTRALGPVRELDVALLTLDEFGSEPGVPPAGLAWLRQSIKRERQAVHRDMQRRIARVDLIKLRKRAQAAARKAQQKGSSRALRDPRRLIAARERAARRAERLHHAIENAAAIYLPDRLHEVRIAVKKLRYALELTRELSGSRATRDLRLMKEAQDLLGRMHDLEVLIARIRAVQGSTGGPNLRQSGQLDQLVRRLETECRQLHGHYISARRRLITICDQAVHLGARAAADTPAA